MLIAVFSRNPEIIAIAKSLSLLDSDVQIVESSRASDLICRMSRRVAIDLIIVDADREFQSAEIIASWRNCHSRKDVAVLLVGRMLGWRRMAQAFELGVDDIVVGSWQVDELYTRSMRCIALNRQRRDRAHPIRLGAYKLDQHTQCIAGNEVRVQLTGQEFALASLFFSKPGVLLARARIAATIWGRSDQDCGRTLEQAVHRLRCKLQLLPDSMLRIKAVYAQGYKLVARAKPERADEPRADVAGLPDDLTAEHVRKERGEREPLFPSLQHRSTKIYGFVVRPPRRVHSTGRRNDSVKSLSRR